MTAMLLKNICGTMIILLRGERNFWDSVLLLMTQRERRKSRKKRTKRFKVGSLKHDEWEKESEGCNRIILFFCTDVTLLYRIVT
jgi:hypothetical protein